MAVAMLALVRAGEVTEVRWGSVTGDGTSRYSREGGCVVRACGEGGVGAVFGVGHESDLTEDAAVLEVAVGEVAVQVVPGDKTFLNVRRKGASPGVAVPVGVEEDSSHAHFGSVSGAQERRVLGHQFSEVGRSVTEAGGQGGEGVDVGPQGLADTDASVGYSVQRHLKCAEEADRSRYRLRNEAELAKYRAPFLLGHSGSGGEEAEDLGEGSLAVRREL